jgi:fucose 4-O-acetylase-like acetyltransferase
MKPIWQGIRDFVSKGLNLSVIQKSRLQWIDYLRGIAIILIVYRHVLVGIERGNIPMPTALVNANMIFYSFRMPLFFILSGIFISSSLAKKSLKELIGIKFEKLFYPYLVWCSLQVTLQIIFSGVTNSNRTLQDYTYIFYQPRYLDQFWYLPALFNTTIIYLLIKTKLKANPGVQLILGLGFYLLAPYLQSISMISDWMAFYFFFALGDSLSTVFFREKSQNFFKSYISLLLIIPIFIVAQRYYLDHNLSNLGITDKSYLSKPDYFRHIKDQVDFLFIALVGCLAMFILAFHLQRLKILSFLRVLGYHSLQIYVMHVIVTAFIRLSLIIVFGITNPVALLFTSMTIGVIVPVFFYNFLIKDGPLWFLFHLKRTTKTKPSTDEARPPVITVVPSAELKS